MIAAEVGTDGLMAQLADEIVTSYDTGVNGDTIDNIVTALLAFQQKTTQVTKGTIAPTDTIALEVTDRTILEVLQTLRDAVGGFIYVDTDRKLQWSTTIGEDKGQQIRYRKNLIGITRETEFDQVCTKLHPLGSEGTKLSDIYVESEEGTKDSDVTYGYLTLGGLYSCYDGWTAAGDALPTDMRIGTGPAWIIPNGHTADGDWDSPAASYDENTDSKSAYDIIFVNWTTFIEFDLPAATNINEVKYMAYKRPAPDTVDKIDVDMWDTGVPGWVGVYEGEFEVGVWESHSFAPLNVTKLRVRFNNTESNRAFPGIYEIRAYSSDVDDTGVWEQGADDHTIRCAIGDFNAGATYGISYWHADYVKAWPEIDAGADIISKFLTNRYESYATTMLEAARLLLAEVKEVPIKYTIDAVDLSRSQDLDFSFDALQLGSTITVIDEDLGIDVSVRVVAITHRDLLHPQKMKLELSTRVESISEYLAGLSKKFE